MLRYLQFPHVSCEENVERFQNMRKECHIKTFDGLEPFSYVCRMIQHEPNTNTTETGKSETVASSVALCEPQLCQHLSMKGMKSCPQI